MKTKICSKCKIEQPINNFNKRTMSYDGLTCNCKQCKKEMADKYYEKNKQKIIDNAKKWRDNNPEKARKISVKSSIKYKKKWKENNREEYLQEKREYYQRKIKDPLFKLKKNLRKRTYTAFRVNNWYKKCNTYEYLGASYEDVYNHIEKQFKDNMSWDNQGEWHIDHIIPLDSANNEEELIKLCHYKNLQPLWAKDNLKKSNKK